MLRDSIEVGQYYLVRNDLNYHERYNGISVNTLMYKYRGKAILISGLIPYKDVCNGEIYDSDNDKTWTFSNEMLVRKISKLEALEEGVLYVE